MEEHSPIVLLMTRWHEDDLAGWLLENEKEEPENWHVVNLEALKEDVPLALPPTCTLEPDWRKPGQPVCPERTSLQRLEAIRGRIGAYFWGALYQQRPSPLEGDYFRRDRGAWFTPKCKCGSRAGCTGKATKKGCP